MIRVQAVAFAFAVAVMSVAACDPPPASDAHAPLTQAPSAKGFRSGDCNLVSDEDVNAVAGAGRFTKVVVNDVGCYWEENSALGAVVGVGLSTWWYRGAELDDERVLESLAGRTQTNFTLNGNAAFESSDETTCSVYTAKDNEMIAWSIQVDIPTDPPELCTIVRRLAQLTQDRVN